MKRHGWRTNTYSCNVNMTTTHTHVPTLSDEILPQSLIHDENVNVGIGYIPSACYSMFTHTHKHTYNMHTYTHTYAHTHTYMHTHVTPHTLHTHNWTHIYIERYIPYYISIRASNTAGYGEAESKTAFTEEGSKINILEFLVF